MPTAAALLSGLTLEGGWKVVQHINPMPGDTGGTFSERYVVERANGEKGFLKAFDFSDAFQPGTDTVKVLLRLTSAFEHERDILKHCSDCRLSYVAVAKAQGYVQVPGLPNAEGKVYYLIFDLAEGDVRRQIDVRTRSDSRWCAEVLRDVVKGLWQVHKQMIAHQDLKPSNVLVFGRDGSRITDFGRASRKGASIWIDNLGVAGDMTYAPPEQLYGHTHADFSARRIGCDLYLFGNLVSFVHTGINVTSEVVSRLDPSMHFVNWAGTYEDVLPFLQRAYNSTLQDIRPQIAIEARADIFPIIQDLCNPDLRKRGHRRGLGKLNQYSVERYVSIFDLVSKRLVKRSSVGVA